MKHIYIGVGITIIGVAVLAFIGMYANSLRTTSYSPYASYSPFPTVEESPTEFPTSSPTIEPTTEPNPNPSPVESPLTCTIDEKQLASVNLKSVNEKINENRNLYNALTARVATLNTNQVATFEKIIAVEVILKKCGAILTPVDEPSPAPLECLLTTSEIEQKKSEREELSRKFDQVLTSLQKASNEENGLNAEYALLSKLKKEIEESIKQCTNLA